MSTNTMLDPGDRNWPLSPLPGSTFGRKKGTVLSCGEAQTQGETQRKAQ